MSHKQGIDYFPFQLDLIEDRKFRRLRNQYGVVAVMVYLSLLCMVFRDKGYYLDYNEQTKSDVIWEILNDLRGKDSPAEEEVAGMIEGLVKAELFDPALFHGGKLTSRRIQKTFYRITCERRDPEVDFSIWLLEEAEMRAISGRSVILKRYLEQEVRPNSGKNRPISEQRKEKERKAKERKEEGGASAPRTAVPPSPKQVFGNVTLSAQELDGLNRQYGADTVKQAITLLDEYMEMTGKRYQSCALAIRRWGIDAVKERAAGKGRASPAKKNAFCNFEQPPLDYDAVQRAMRKGAQE